MNIDSTGRIIQFAEKPKGTDLKAMVASLYLSHLFFELQFLVIDLIKILSGLL